MTRGEFDKEIRFQIEDICAALRGKQDDSPLLDRCVHCGRVIIDPYISSFPTETADGFVWAHAICRLDPDYYKRDTT
jgi:hypothetical protein